MVKNKEISIFHHPQFGDVRTMTMPDGQVGFVGRDVAAALGYTNPTKACQVHVDDEDKLMYKMDTSFGAKDTLFINESGLYSLVLSSKLPQAREFKHWVTGEVLPQIRRTGGYIPVGAADDEVTIMARALQIMQRTIGQKDELIERQTALIEEQRPKALFCDAVTGSVGVICIRELAKLICQNGYDIGEKRLYEWLRTHEYLCTKGAAYNVPQQRYLEQGLFRIEEFTYTDSHGIVHTRLTPKVTGKGQLYFINLFKNLYHQGV